jgi:capsular polysaccharide biosynthesis protein
MDGPSFKAALKVAWFPALAVLIIFIVGSMVYVKERIPPSAEGSVAVRDALSVNGGSNSSAAVTFDAIIQSDTLAKRVAHQLRLPVGTVKGALSVTTVLPSTGINISPLYQIKAKASTLTLAEEIVNTAITQGRVMYGQLNSMDPAATKAELAAELHADDLTLLGAQSALNTFVASSGGDHSAEISALGTEISGFTSEVAQAQVGVAANTATPAQVAVLQSQLNSAEQQLASLQSAQSKYQQLSAAVTSAQANVSQIQNLQGLTDAAAAPPTSSEVKVLDFASASSNSLIIILVYALGVILGLLGAFTVIYLVAARQRKRLSPNEFVAALDLPTLGRIPRHAIPRGA